MIKTGANFCIFGWKKRGGLEAFIGHFSSLMSIFKTFLRWEKLLDIYKEMKGVKILECYLLTIFILALQSNVWIDTEMLLYAV